MPAGARWAILVALSAAFGAALEMVRLPAGILLGPMAAATLVAAFGNGVRIAPWPLRLAQGVVGCMIAGSITPAILGTIARDWPLFLGLVATVIAASACFGGLLARWRVLPGTVAIWGSSAGAATAMTLIAEAHGADVRLVAFMQYLRVVFVALAASAVARLFTDHAPVGAGFSATALFPPVDWPRFAGTLAIAGLGSAAGVRLRVPAGALLLPLGLGAVLHGSGLFTPALPPWLLAVSYAVIGWSIGSRFTRAILGHVARALPRVAGSIVLLIALCGVLAALLVAVAGVDPLTAYLATSPGGADSVAIIAASSHVDVPFVMAMQTARLLIVIAIGPTLARLVARWAGAVDEPIARPNS